MDDLSSRKRALRMRAGRRGYLEVELTMRPFLNKHLGAMNEAQVEELEILAELEDLELWNVISGKKTPPKGVTRKLVQLIRASAVGADA